jgi:hypothetical protein
LAAEVRAALNGPHVEGLFAKLAKGIEHAVVHGGVSAGDRSVHDDAG